MKSFPETSLSCNRLALDLLLKAVRRAELISPLETKHGKLQKADLDPSVSVIPFRELLVGNPCRLVAQASACKMFSRCRHFLTKLRGMEQWKVLASGSPSDINWKILNVCPRFLTARKKPASGARRLLTRSAELLPDSYPIALIS